jgi:hypothetical protein
MRASSATTRCACASATRPSATSSSSTSKGPSAPRPWDERAFYAERAALLRAAVREQAASGGRFTPLRVRLEEAARALARRLR